MTVTRRLHRPLQLRFGVNNRDRGARNDCPARIRNRPNDVCSYDLRYQVLDREHIRQNGKKQCPPGQYCPQARLCISKIRGSSALSE